MVKKSKKAVSGVVIAVLLILLAIILSTSIILFSGNFLDKIKKEAAAEKARQECGKIYEVQIEACLNSKENKVTINLINLNEEIPVGSLVEYNSGYTKIFRPIVEATRPIAQGAGVSINIEELNINLTEFNLKTIKLIPIYTNNNIRVICEELDSAEINPC